MKSSPNHLCGQTEVVLCALQFHSLETSCFPQWGLAWLFSLISWPSLPLAEVSDQWLAFSSTFDLPYLCSQQMLPCLCTSDRLHWVGGHLCREWCWIINRDAGANWTNNAGVMQLKQSLDFLYHLFYIIFLSRWAMKLELIFSVPIPCSLIISLAPFSSSSLVLLFSM